MFACAVIKGNLPFKTHNVLKTQCLSYSFTKQVKVLRFKVVLIQRKQSLSQFKSCEMLIFQIYVYKGENKQWYFRFTPTEIYNPNSEVPLAVSLYQSNKEGYYLSDISGLGTNGVHVQHLNKVFTDVIDVQPYYCVVDCIDNWDDRNDPLSFTNQDNVYIEFSEYADFRESYKFDLKK